MRQLGRYPGLDGRWAFQSGRRSLYSGPRRKILASASSPIVATATVTASSTKTPCAIHCLLDPTTLSSIFWSQPWRSLDVRWTIVSGGPAGNYTTGLQEARSTQNGPVAGLLIVSAGSTSPTNFTVRCTITDGFGNTLVKDNTVTCQDWANDTNTTVCANASFVGLPANLSNAIQVTTSDFDAGVAPLLLSGKRVLMKKGDSFPTSAAVTYNTAIVGAQLGSWNPGAGGRPIVASSTAINTLELASASINDLVIQGIEFNGSDAGSAFCKGQANFTGVTFYDCDISDIGDGYSSTGTTIQNSLAFFECAGTNMTKASNQGLICFAQASKFMFVGNNFNNSASAGAYNLRMPFVRYGCVSNSSFVGSTARGMIKMHAPTYATDADISNWNLICANKGTGGNSKLVEMNPQTSNNDERVEDSIFERNWIIADASSGGMLWLGGTRVTVRNNVYVATGALTEQGIFVERRGNAPAPTPTDCWIYNNAMYSTGNQSQSWMINIGEGGPASGTICANNAFWEPNNNKTPGNDPRTVQDAGTGTIGATGTYGNSSLSQIQFTVVSGNRPFANSAPANVLTGEFQAFNYAIGGGINSGAGITNGVATLTDIFYVARSISSMDSGADKS